MRLSCHTLGLVVAIALLAGTLEAQDPADDRFWVEDDTRGARELKRIRHQEQNGDIVGAIQAYHGLLEKPGAQGVFPLIPAEEGKPYALYVGVREACRQAIARLDPLRLAQYRASYDGKALRLLHEAWSRRDLAALRGVASTYEATSYGDEALLAIAELSVEQDDAAGASAALVALLRSPGSYEVTLSQLRVALFRYAWCQRKLGRRDRLLALHGVASGGEALLAAFAGLLSFAGHALDPILLRHRAIFDVPVDANGARVTLREAIARLAAMEGRVEGPLPALGREPAWSVSLPPPQMLPPMGNTDVVIWAMGNDVANLNLVLWDPSIEAGISPASGIACAPPWVFVHTGAEGLVLDGRTGEEAPWKWSNGDLLEPDDAVGKGRLSRRARIRGNRMYASLESGWQPYVTKEGDVEQTVSRILHCRLYAFDLSREGYRLWDTERPTGKSDDVEFLSKVTIISPPAADGTTVYAGGAILENDLRLYVIALDARNGQLRWKTYLGAAETNATRWQRPDTAERVFPSLAPVLAEGLVYFCSNWGIVAALDAGNGEVKWVVKYGRKRSQAGRGGEPDWAENGVEVVDGLVVAAPQDSDYLFCFDAATGRLIGEPFARVTDKLSFRYYIAMPGGRIALLSDKVAWIGAIEEPGHSLAKVKLQEPAIGRPLRDGGDLIVPGAKAVYRVRVREKRLEELFRWPEKASGGIELVRIEDGLVALTRERVYGYR